jgi:CBS domain-containing protein
MPNVGEICSRDVVVARRTTSLVEAARLMRERHVGDVVVVEERNGMRVPVGILTDRDVVVGVVARCEPYLDKLTVGDVVTRAAVATHEDEDIFRLVRRMRAEGIRRMPVVDKYGGLVGIVALDDVLALLADTLLELSGVGPGQQRREARQRP